MSKSRKQKRGANLPGNTIWQRKLWRERSLILGGFLLLVAVASIYAFTRTQQSSVRAERLAPPSHIVTPEENSLSGKTAFGQFPPYTEADRELEKLLHGKDEDIDLALANWLIAADIPQFSDLTREAYFKQLDAMIGQVRQEMARMQGVAIERGENLNAPKTRCAIFCNAIIKLRFTYTEEFRQETITPALMKALYTDANNIFLAGLFRTRRGSCVSMPLIYLVIGQRLGMPVHLVAIGKHYFIRWEEPGYRMNVETTIVDKVSVTPDESVYLEAEGMTRDQLTGSDLRNLTCREVVGNLFFARSAYWAIRGPERSTQQCLDLSHARHLAPDDPGIQASHQKVFDHYGIKPEHTSIEIKPKERKGNSI